jgi:hypothetical protein
MLRFSGMPAPSRPLLQADNYLLGNIPHDELCHIAINDSIGNPARAGGSAGRDQTVSPVGERRAGPGGKSHARGGLASPPRTLPGIQFLAWLGNELLR